MRRGLRHTAAYWPALRRAYAWVDRAAAILTNERSEGGDAVRRRFTGLVGALTRAVARRGPHRDALRHFLKVTRSYWPGLFHCYDVADLPRTNNGIEQFFGAHRYGERRASGRKAAAPGVVVRGAARLLAGAATRQQRVDGSALAPADLTAWRTLRATLTARSLPRTLGRRFRHNPEGYLRRIEEDLIQATLPP